MPIADNFDMISLPDKSSFFPVETLSEQTITPAWICLLYTSDAVDERSSVDLGGRRIIKKKKSKKKKKKREKE